MVLAAFSAHLGAETKRPPLKVSINVTADQPERGIIAGYLEQQLGTLKDVKVTDDGAAIGIDVIATRVTVEGVDVGIAVSSAVYFTFGAEALHSNIRGHSLHMTKVDQLPATCAMIVARFEEDVLEPIRVILLLSK